MQSYREANVERTKAVDRATVAAKMKVKIVINGFAVKDVTEMATGTTPGRENKKNAMQF